MGPLMIDIQGLTLCDEDKQLLRHKSVAGIILFSRNFQDPQQLTALIKEIRSITSQRLLITVDHEGGRVQRFRQGFTAIPPAQAYAKLRNLVTAEQLAYDAGWVLAMELMAFDIDLSYAPVLDLGHQSLAIGSRSFHQDCVIATRIARAMINGMHDAGMKTTGKHFPGHGAVFADSHKETPIDDRNQSKITNDMQIFVDLIKDNQLDAIMPAHVIYSSFDDRPASGSDFWLKKVLKEQLNFKGVIFSDDLSMEGAAFLGDYTQRAKAALLAGCDILLACNNRTGTLAILDSLANMTSNKPAALCSQPIMNYSTLLNNAEWQQRNKKLNQLNDDWLKMLNL